ncbi:MAG: hypothetical protein KF746_10180 [Chitinophagaceae bacterium]|nr:hypothetical protein [Chitinophagaceae bacterium]
MKYKEQSNNGCIPNYRLLVGTPAGTARGKLMKYICWIAFFSAGLLFAACKKDKNESASDLIKQYKIAGTYSAQITPSFMGTNPVATGEHPIRFEDLGDGRIRMFFEKFRQDPMPFMMTVDIIMTVKKGPGNSLVLEGKDGIFRADPPDGNAIDPDDFIPGIQLPDGAENGMASSQSSISGTYEETEKDGEKALRYNLNVNPGLPLPIQVLIYTRHKIS